MPLGIRPARPRSHLDLSVEAGARHMSEMTPMSEITSEKYAESIKLEEYVLEMGLDV